MSDLTPKEHRFVTEYLFDLNGTKAAIRAGYRKASAATMASELLRKPHVAQAVEAAKLEREERVKFNADDVLSILANAARADDLDIYDDNGNLLPMEEWPLAYRQGLVQEIETRSETDEETGEVISTVTKVKLVDRSKFIALAGKHISVKAFQETVGVKGIGSIAERLDRAAAREAEAAALVAVTVTEPAPVAVSEDISDG